MTSAGHPPNHPQPPAQANSHPQPAATQPQAASPPSKRDLKSWWKGFKLASKNVEQNGTDPFTSSSDTDTDTGTHPHHQAGTQGGNAQHDQSTSSFFHNILKPEDEDAQARGDQQSSDGSPPAKFCRRSKGLCRPARLILAPLSKAIKKLKKLKKLKKTKTKTSTTEPTRPQGIFGVPLRQSITYANVAISLIDSNGKSYIYGYVPIVVAKCGVFLKEKATGVEGIFRLSGSEKRIKELKAAFDSPDRYGKGLVWDGYTVHDAANVLRRYLNDLPEPVVPLDLYERFREPLRGATKQAVGDAEGPQFVDNFDMKAAIVKYQHLITELPPLNRQLLLYILDLLAVFAAKSDENRMNSQNLAAIFQPGMLSHPTHAMAPEEYRLNQCVIIFLIENQDHFLIGMQGTAADEQTVQAVQQGTPPANAPATPVVARTSGIVRSSSSASAGAESVAREGKIRRNRSTSSRHSRQSNGAPSPGSPALTATPSSGLGRSNTVPSKKSPAIGSGRFQRRHDQTSSPVAPLTPIAQSHMPATPTVQEVTTPPETQPDPQQVFSPAAADASSRLAAQAGLPAKVPEKQFLEPTPEVATPSKERKLQNLFQRSPGNDGDSRQPNKLRKKRLPGSANPSAQSSTASLPRSTGPSPSAEIRDPMDSLDAASSSVQHQPYPEMKSASETPSEPTPRASQIPATSTPPAPTEAAHEPPAHEHAASSGSLHPASAEQLLRSKRSPPTSLHSSFNEGSDMDQVDETLAPSERSEPEKEKRRLWRLSRRKEDTTHPSVTSQPQSSQQALGANTHAEISTSSVGSTGYKARSFTGESSDPATLMTAEGQSSQDSTKDGREDSRGLTGWIKNKYREAKDHSRTKSPPADRPSLGSNILPSRGKSFDLTRKAEEEKAEAQPEAPSAPAPPPPQ
ncbi:uncharacterized protein E0L32_009529 [Thyridium curvatum]|uniref:Rho-GAP domain-containing protein n=1 Tax=Thyridium curvatum TaxID=1093900 RepID=A0A507AXD4_9PEZI|nr:uncharacterized protein E0L32_009529 [Thyridium curvatum]TPX08950.1 hypothetical protein E0L32_009529 [Thyridium curvatum]